MGGKSKKSKPKGRLFYIDSDTGKPQWEKPYDPAHLSTNYTMSGTNLRMFEKSVENLNKVANDGYKRIEEQQLGVAEEVDLLVRIVEPLIEECDTLKPKNISRNNRFIQILDEQKLTYKWRSKCTILASKIPRQSTKYDEFEKDMLRNGWGQIVRPGIIKRLKDHWKDSDQRLLDEALALRKCIQVSDDKIPSIPEIPAPCRKPV